MDDKIATLTKEVWTQEKSLTDKKARLMALLPYLQAAVEDITGMDNLLYPATGADTCGHRSSGRRSV